MVSLAFGTILEKGGTGIAVYGGRASYVAQ